MRVWDGKENLVGKVCVCSIGRPAIVIGKREREDVWIGLGLDGKGNWGSSKPCIIAEDALAFYEKLHQRFDGKLG